MLFLASPTGWMPFYGYICTIIRSIYMNDSNKTLHSMEMTHTWVEIFKFQPPGGVAEYHVTIRVTDSRLTFVEQAEAVQAGLQKQDADLRELQQRLGTEFQAETEKFNKALRDSIQHYLAVYNKTKKYSLIISKAGDNILYADKAYDITDEVIAGLNKAYKPAPAKKK